MGAGDRTVFVALQEVTAGSDDAFGAPSETWAELARAWAEKADISDGEKVTAGMEFSARVARFRLPWNPTVAGFSAEGRLVDLESSDVWSVRGIKESGRRDMIEITAERRSD